jgi:gluconolactonase
MSYSEEFDNLLGPKPEPKLVAERSSPFAGEGGVWVPSRNEVWSTSSIYPGYASRSVLDLNTPTINHPSLSQPLVNPTGGYYINGLVYFTAFGNETYAGGVYSIDPATGQTEIVVNSYLGFRFNAPDDMTWAAVPSGTDASNGTEKKGVMFFADNTDRSLITNYTTPDPLSNGIWRFDSTEHFLTPVITRADILAPNGIQVNKDSTLLYVTDSSPTVEGVAAVGGGNASPGSPAIYRYNISSDGFPHNKQLVSFARRGIPDGLHIDDVGRIWTGEYEGVVVRSPAGKVLGLFNAEYFLRGDNEGSASIKEANFALAGDKLVLFAQYRLCTIKLNKALVDPSRFEL